MSTWGIDGSLPNPVIATAGADVACPAGTETNVVGGTVTVLNTALNSVLLAIASMVVVLGATPPTALVIALRPGTGADYDTYTVSPTALVANAILNLTVPLSVSFSRGFTQFGLALNVSVNATGQAVTAKAGARVILTVLPGADA